MHLYTAYKCGGRQCIRYFAYNCGRKQCICYIVLNSGGKQCICYIAYNCGGKQCICYISNNCGGKQCICYIAIFVLIWRCLQKHRICYYVGCTLVLNSSSTLYTDPLSGIGLIGHCRRTNSGVTIHTASIMASILKYSKYRKINK